MAEARSFHRGPGYLIFHSIGPGSPEHSQRHLHDEYVISCQLRGGELREFSREVTRVEPGDIVTINPQQVHSSRALDPAECTETREFLTFYVERDAVDAVVTDLGLENMSPEFTANQSRDVPQITDRARELHALTVSYLQRRSACVGGEAEQCMNLDAELRAINETRDILVLDTLESFSNLRRPMRRSVARVRDWRVAKTMRYIKQRVLQEPGWSPSTEELAATTGLSKCYFLRAFDKQVGMTPGAYLRALRLCMGATMLKVPNSAIAEVAENTGYASHAAFSRSFRRYFGLSPIEYRRIWTE